MASQKSRSLHNIKNLRIFFLTLFLSFTGACSITDQKITDLQSFTMTKSAGVIPFDAEFSWSFRSVAKLGKTKCEIDWEGDGKVDVVLDDCTSKTTITHRYEKYGAYQPKMTVYHEGESIAVRQLEAYANYIEFNDNVLQLDDLTSVSVLYNEQGQMIVQNPSNAAPLPPIRAGQILWSRIHPNQYGLSVYVTQVLQASEHQWTLEIRPASLNEAIKHAFFGAVRNSQTLSTKQPLNMGGYGKSSSPLVLADFVDLAFTGYITFEELDIGGLRVPKTSLEATFLVNKIMLEIGLSSIKKFIFNCEVRLKGKMTFAFDRSLKLDTTLPLSPKAIPLGTAQLGPFNIIVKTKPHLKLKLTPLAEIALEIELAFQAGLNAEYDPSRGFTFSKNFSITPTLNAYLSQNPTIATELLSGSVGFSPGFVVALQGIDLLFFEPSVYFEGSADTKLSKEGVNLCYRFGAGVEGEARFEVDIFDKLKASGKTTIGAKIWEGDEHCRFLYKNCQTSAKKECRGGNLVSLDSCGSIENTLEYCFAGCVNGACKQPSRNCSPDDSSICVGSELYSFDSCGNQGKKLQSCQYGCINGRCQARSQTITPRVLVSPSSGKPGTLFQQNGTGFSPNNTVTLYFIDPNGNMLPSLQKQTDSSGSYTNTYTSRSNDKIGKYEHYAVDNKTNTRTPSVYYEFLSDTAPSISPKVSISPSYGALGTTFQQNGTGFSPNSSVTLYFKDPNGNILPTTSKTTDAVGSYTHSYTSKTTDAVGRYEYYAVDNKTGKKSNSVYYDFLQSSLRPQVFVSPSSGKPGTKFQQNGTGFTPNSRVVLYFKDPDGNLLPTVPKTTDSNGNYTHDYTSKTTDKIGRYEYYAIDNTTNSRSSSVFYEFVTETTPTLNPRVTVSPSSGILGTTFQQNGTGFSPNSTVTLYFKVPDGTVLPSVTKTTDANGNYTHSYTSKPTDTAGVYSYYARDDKTGQLSNTVSYTFLQNVVVSPIVTVTPSSGPLGTVFHQNGTGFTPGGTASLYFQSPTGQNYPPVPKNIDSNGNYTHDYTSQMTDIPGNYRYWAVDDRTGKSSTVVNYQFTANPVVTVSPPSGVLGTFFQQDGYGCTPNGSVELYFQTPSGTVYPPVQKQADINGRYSHGYQSKATDATGTYFYWAVDMATGRQSQKVSYTFR